MPAVYDELHEAARRIEPVFPADELECLCHNDLLPANVLLAADRHWLIDFEYAGMNQALFDLANLSVNCAFDDEATTPAARRLRRRRVGRARSPSSA